jgi:hypothetical protein
MLTYDDLARACRENDALAEKVGLIETIKQLGADFSGFANVADQRGMRGVLHTRGREIEYGVPVHFSKEEMAELTMLKAAVMDGIAIGLRAALNRSTEDDLPKQP